MPTLENTTGARLTEGHLDLDAVRWVGTGLVRPECVLATVTGDIYTADWRGGVAHIRPDGSQALYVGLPVDGEPLKPNGVALLKDGSFLLAHLGAEQGGVFHLSRDGQTRPYLRTSMALTCRRATLWSKMRGPDLDHGQHAPDAARPGLPALLQRRLCRDGGRCRRPDRGRWTGLHQRVPGRSFGPVAVCQRDLLQAPVTFPAAGRWLAGRQGGRDRVRRRGVSRMVWRSTPRAASGSSAS